MGVFGSGSIDFQAIGSQMAATALPWMNGSIQIIDPNTEDSEWNPFTNQYTNDTPTVLWSGPARIQHLSTQATPTVGGSQIGIRGIRVQIPIDAAAGFIRKGLQVVVTDAGNDYELEQLQFVINSAINSSYAWLRTLECEVDVKSVANATWSSVAGTVQSATSNAIAGAAVRSFHHEDDLWIMDYETTTDVLGNYEIPADAGVPITVVASAPGYITGYFDGAASFSLATTVTPVNHEETQNIDFVLEVD